MSAPTPWKTLAPELSKLMILELREPMKSAFTRADDVLFDLSNDGADQDYLEALRYVRQEKEHLISKWEDKLSSAIRMWSKSKEDNFINMELTLVSNDELEEKLAINQMSEAFAKPNKKAFDILYPIWEKVASDINAAQDTDVDADIFPLTNIGLACLIGDWFESVQLDLKIKVVFLKIIEREMVTILNKFLSKVADFLKDASWPIEQMQPSFKSRSQENQSQDLNSNEDDNLDDTTSLGNQEDFLKDNTVPTLSNANSLISDYENNAIGQSQLIQQAHNFSQNQAPPSHQTYSPQPYGPPYAPQQFLPPYQNFLPRHTNFSQGNARLLASALQKLFSSQQSLDGEGLDGDGFGESFDNNFDDFKEDDWDPAIDDLVSLINTRRKSSKRSSKERQLTPVLPSKVVRSVLNDFQITVPDSVKKAARANDSSISQQFKAEMLIRAQQMDGAEKDARLNDQDEDTVDIVGMLFEMFLSERHLREDMREDIAKLLAPYIKVAMIDRKLFMHRHHPARKLLDTVAEAVEGNMGDNRQEQEALKQVSISIDKLTAEYNEDIAIFDLIEAEVRAFVIQQKARIELSEKRAAEAQKGKEKLELSKAISQERFKEKTKDLNWPVKTMELLKNYWAQHYMMMMLRAPEDQKESEITSLVDAMSLLDDLIEIGSEGISRTAHKAKSCHDAVIDMLSSSGIIDNSAQEIAMDIWSALDQSSRWMGLDQGFSPVPVKDLEVSSDSSTLDPSQASNLDSAEQRQPGSLHNGSMHDSKGEVEDLEQELASEDIKPVWVQNKIENPQTEIMIPTSYVADDNTLKYNFKNPDESRGKVVIAKVNDMELVAYFENMPDGSWVEFIRSDGSIVPAKKSWVSPISGRVLFVNKKGGQYAVESPQELALKVRLGQVRIPDVALGAEGFDRSLKKAIDTLSSKEEVG